MFRRQNALALIGLAVFALAACQTTPRLTPREASLTSPHSSALLDHPSATTRPV